ncbi:hypothetical protein JD969_08435 [Planctomycetota bacterium]|nr:hypothetical protein JD969_08435 [Planctomycetota bacterium]
MIPLHNELAEAYINTLKFPATPNREHDITYNLKLFRFPHEIIRIYDRDVAAESIPKHNQRGHAVDIHTLRYK